MRTVEEIRAKLKELQKYFDEELRDLQRKYDEFDRESIGDDPGCTLDQLQLNINLLVWVLGE